MGGYLLQEMVHHENLNFETWTMNSTYTLKTINTYTHNQLSDISCRILI